MKHWLVHQPGTDPVTNCMFTVAGPFATAESVLQFWADKQETPEAAKYWLTYTATLLIDVEVSPCRCGREAAASTVNRHTKIEYECDPWAHLTCSSPYVYIKCWACGVRTSGSAVNTQGAEREAAVWNKVMGKTPQGTGTGISAIDPSCACHACCVLREAVALAVAEGGA